MPKDERDGVDEILDQWARERPDLDASPIGVVGRISRLARELVDRASEAHLANEHRLLSVLTDAERERLADLLRKLRLGLPGD